MVIISGVRVYAHAVAWETHTGKPVPPGMIVRHRCDNPRCGEPKHLEIGDHGDNLSDQYLRGRRKRRTKDLWSQRGS